MLEKAMKSKNVSIDDILDSIKVGIYVTDGEGNTLALNKECCKTGSLPKEEIVGKNMKELMEIGYVRESDSFRVMKSGKEERLIQNLGDGGKIYITGVPIYKNGKIAMIVSTERDLTEIGELEKLLNESKEQNKKYEKRMAYLCQSNMFKGEIVAQSLLMNQVLEQAERIGKLDTTVLIQGESGTGKEIIADYIYKTGNRFGSAFIKVNCAAIPETLIESEFFGYEKGTFTGAEKEGKIGLFEAADGGTIFLDEIGDLPMAMQGKLLRAIQEKEVRRVGGNEAKHVDVRIIAATNINLREAVKDGKFREDLYYRLNVASLEVPPLRGRKEDIKPLAEYFINRFNGKYGMNKSIQEDGLQILEEYNWPGNVRELGNIIERIMVSYEGDIITKFMLFKQINGCSTKYLRDKEELSLKEIVERYEKEVIVQYMDDCSTGQELAKVLNVDQATISRKLKKYNLNR